MGLLNLFTGFRGPPRVSPVETHFWINLILAWAVAPRFLSFAAAQRILLDCSGTMRRLRVLPDLRKAQSRPLLPRQGRKNLRRLLRHRARSYYRLPLRLLLSPCRPPLRRRAPALPTRGHS